MNNSSSNMKTRYLFLVIGLILISCNPFKHDVSISQEKIDSIDNLLSSLHEEGIFNGSFFIADDEKLLFNKVYGFANLDEGIPLRSETLFSIASVSKTMTATLTMKLIEDGIIASDSKLTEFFPDLPYEDITVQHLLNHTSGIPFYYDSVITKHWEVGKQLNTDTLFSLYEEFQPSNEFVPGEKFSYSNAGYMFLAGIAERATNETFDDLLEKYIFQPASMRYTKRDVFLDDSEDYAIGHQLSFEKGKYVTLSNHEDENLFLDSFFKDSKGPGGIYSNTQDLWNYSKAIRSNLILTQESTKNMFSPGILTSGAYTSYGKGWQLSSRKGNQIVSHRGGDEGGNCFFSIIDGTYTYFLVTNVKSLHLSEINQQLNNILFDKPVERIKKSGFERLALLLNSSTFEQLEQEIAYIQDRPEEYYFALHEFNEISWRYWQRKDYERGMEIIHLATMAMPDNAGAFEVLAQAYQELGDNKLAIESYNKTIELLNADESKRDKKWVREWILEIEEIIDDLNN